MKEQHVLAAAMKDRKAYEQVEPYVERGDLSEQGWLVWGGITEFYTNDPEADSCDYDLLADSVARGMASDKHKDMLRQVVRGVSEFEVSTPNVVDYLLEHKRAIVGNELANELLSGRKPNGLLDEYQRLQSATTLGDSEEVEVRSGFDVTQLVRDKFSSDSLLSISPSALDSRLEGSLKPGHHIVLFARPEMGKTMMTIEMVAGFLEQGLRVLYVGNEDPLDDINMRVVNRLSEMTKKEVLENPSKAGLRATERGYDALSLASLAPGTPHEIEGLIEAVNPHVLIIDQLRNLNMGQDNYVLALEKAATKAREWAKRHQILVISVTQAGDSASGKAVLDLGDVDYSNTGIPAQADVMVGLGATDKNMMRGEVVVSLPKNKVSGNHEWFTLLTHPHISKLESLD